LYVKHIRPGSGLPPGAPFFEGREDGWANREPATVTVCPQHALLIVEDRLREQEAEGVRMPEGMALDELALRILIAAETSRVPSPGGLTRMKWEPTFGLRPRRIGDEAGSSGSEGTGP
jgi:hypothetical protein